MALPDLDALVRDVSERSRTDDALERLGAAARASRDVERLADALLDHFVQEARAAGHSWTRIGSVLGVSKQAAQQRHSARSVARRLLERLPGFGQDRGFFHRFTAGSRSVVIGAQEVARDLGHDHVGTEHILLALLQVEDTVAAEALAAAGTGLDDVRGRVTAIVPEGGTPSVGHLPFTAGAKKVLELALRESITLRHPHVGPEHILLGILREGEGVAGRVLEAAGADRRALREAVLRLAGTGV